MISAIGNNFVNNINYRYNTQKKYPINNYLLHDTVSFKSTKLLSQNAKDITKIVKEAISNEKNFIGAGAEGKVFSIPNTEYCVKFLHDTKPKLDKWNFHMLPHQEVNHVVATSDSGVTIMKKIKGVQLSYGKEPKEIYYLPDESYRKLFLQINDASKAHMEFDVTPRNIIYDKENKALTIIDFHKEQSIYKGKKFEPFKNVYQCLKAKDNSKESIKTNTEFGEKLLKIAVEELDKSDSKKIPVIYDDLSSLCEDLKWDNCFSAKANKYKDILDARLNKPKLFSLFEHFHKNQSVKFY